MSRTRVPAPSPGAAFFVLLLLLLPAISLALPAGTPPLSPATRAALSSAAEHQVLQPWQRQFMRSLAGGTPAPAHAAGTAGVDGAWRQLPPPSVQETPGVFDRVRQSMLIFSGATRNDESTRSDVWELSLAGTPTWSILQTTGTPPPPRSGHGLLFDSRRERLLVFGGCDSITRNDCWALDLTTAPPVWFQALPGGPLPPRRAYMSGVYDSLYDRVVVFGGADSVAAKSGPASVVGDLWTLPLSGGPFSWTQLTLPGTPSPRAGAAAIYDYSRQRMVLFGGLGASALNDCYTLSLGASPAWAPLGTSGGPPPGRAIPGVIHEFPPQDRMVMYGGFDGSGPIDDVWALDLATSAWTQLSPTGGPPTARQFPAVVYDQRRARMVVFGGNGMDGSVDDPLWSLSLGATPAWTDLGGRRPPTLWSSATVIDPTRRVMWVHGGQAWDNGVMTRTDLWALPLGTPAGWNQPATTGTPPGKRYGHTAIYDTPRDRLVFFGGNDSLASLNEVWALTLSGTPAWSQLSPTGTPPAGRHFHSALYDAVNDRMVVFGGSTATGNQSDVWALTLSGTPAWSQLSPTGTPPDPLWSQSAAHDRDANRLIVFGGMSGGPRNDVYALTLTGSPVWSQLFPTGTLPAPRQAASMVSLGTRMLVFGGDTVGTGGAAADTWLLSLYPTPSWRRLDVGPSVPEARWAHNAVFDQTSFRMVVCGGTGLSSNRADTWMLQIDQLVPALASLVSANARPGRVELSWEVAASVGSVRLYRRSGGGEWTALDRLAPDGTGRIAYVDLDVVAGSRYGYRLGLSTADGEVIAGEIWVDVPDGSQLALRGMTPNPAPAGAGLIAFSLPDASPARLELVDVSGRQVFSREVGSLGRGDHVIQVGGARRLAPGLYLVRLTQGGRSLTAKAVAIR